MIKEIERCVYCSEKENTTFEIFAEKEDALIKRRTGGKKLFSKNEFKKKVDIKYLRSLDIFFEPYEFDTWDKNEPEGKSFVRIDYKGESFFGGNDEIIEDIERYFNACLNETAKPVVLSFHSFDGGGPEYSFKNEVKGIFTWYCERKYLKADHEELCGAGYNIYYTLYPLRKGKASALITASSPICFEPAKRLFAEVDDELRIIYRIEITEER